MGVLTCQGRYHTCRVMGALSAGRKLPSRCEWTNHPQPPSIAMQAKRTRPDSCSLYILGGTVVHVLDEKGREASIAIEARFADRVIEDVVERQLGARRPRQRQEVDHPDQGARCMRDFSEGAQPPHGTWCPG